MLDLPSCLVVDSSVAHVHAVALDAETHTLVLTMESTPTTATCPACGHPAHRIHSQYHRTLADVSWTLVPVRIHLQVRRFFCAQPACPRRIFTERLPTLVQPYARRTTRLARLQQQIGLLVGGAAGAVLCRILGMPAGVDLLLTLIRRCSPPEPPTPRVLGVDDWALRKGQRYGTILVDHEREQIVDLLPDRTPQSVRDWLRAHPGVEIVTRDRAEAYAQGITEGAPAALQVADRWHLLKNLTDTLTTVLQDHRPAILQQLTPAEPPALLSAATDTTRAALPACPDVGAEEAAAIPPRGPTASEARRQTRAAEIHHLYAHGWLQKDIAAHLHCHPKTVRRTLQRTLPLSIGRGPRWRNVTPYQSYLLERWNAGCHNASQLFREIQQQGFTGQLTMLRAVVRSLRVQSGMPARSRTAPSAPLTRAALHRVPSSHTLAWLSTQPAARLDEEQRVFHAQLITVNATVTTAVQLAQRFATMVRDRQAPALDDWLADAHHCGIAALRSLANGIRQDLDAVRAALTVGWSNGRTEGSVNRLKCVRRQMYGRGKLDLLRLRLIAT